MIIRHIGHAEFLIETESGYRIITDPYDTNCGYPVVQVAADAVLVSHGHHDHCAVENIPGNPVLIQKEGIYSPEPMIRVTAISAFHDESKGAKRGTTLLFLIECEGIKLVHLGDLGCLLDAEQISVLRKPDILMMPVGGYYTIDAVQAKQTADDLDARIILPMHYRTSYNPDWPITGPEKFVEQMTGESVMYGSEALRVTAGDIECQPRIVLFRPYSTVHTTGERTE